MVNASPFPAIRQRGIPPEHFLPGRRSCAQRLLEDNLTRCVRHAITLQRSPKSKPIVSFCWEKFLLRFAAAVLTFFIAGLLYLLRFERVDNWGAYSLPPETGLLIPSGYINYAGFLAAA
jgi:hypothetical protein